MDFGLDTWFLPQVELPNAAWYARSNLKGLLKYVHSLDDVLHIERRSLWTESGGNFAEKLREAAEKMSMGRPRNATVARPLDLGATC